MPHRFASLCAALFFASASGSIGLAQLPVEDLLSRGQAFIDEGRAGRALVVFKRARARAEAEGRKCPECLVAMVTARTRMHNPMAAERTARRVLELTDDPLFTVSAYNYVGLSIFDQSIYRVPSPWDAKTVRDPAHRGFLRKMQEAEAAFRKALELSEDDPEVLRWNLATALEWQGRQDEALPLFYSGADPAEWDSWEDEGKDDPSRISSEIQPPKSISKTQPEHSMLARATGIEGRVVLRAILGKNGQVRDVRVVEGLPGLTINAIRAVREWRWEPARWNGEPIDVRYQLTVNFELE